MAGKIDAKTMDKPKEMGDNWESDEEDNWEDWGDAEDDLEIQQSSANRSNQHIITNKNIANARNDENFNFNDKDTKNIQDGNANRTVDNEQSEQRHNTQIQSTKSSWSSMWGGVMSTVLSTATEGLGNITSTVSHGLNQVIGVPDPEDLARMNADEKAKQTNEKPIGNDENEKENEDKSVEKQKTEQESSDGSGFGLNLNLVSTIGNKVLNTGLDTLEGIGKKTMDILQENDPLLKKKRKMLGLETEKPNLSEVLKEAKKDAEKLENTLKELSLERSKELLRFDTLFENNCGQVHLEALEILSKESTYKLQALLSSMQGNALAELQETVDEVKELLELEDLEGESDGDYSAEELNEKLLSAVEDADLKITFDDIINNWSRSLEWIATTTISDSASEQEIFAKGITALAETCALEMCKLHKIAELLLVKEHHSTANEVDNIVQLCKQFSLHLNGLTNRYVALLNAKQSDDVKRHISDLFAEMVVANQHVEKAFRLFLPILQMGAV